MKVQNAFVIRRKTLMRMLTTEVGAAWAAFGIYVARNINTIMLRPNYVASESFFA